MESKELVEEEIFKNLKEIAARIGKPPNYRLFFSQEYQGSKSSIPLISLRKLQFDQP
jgi:hypothetical protein